MFDFCESSLLNHLIIIKTNVVGTSMDWVWMGESILFIWHALTHTLKIELELVILNFQTQGSDIMYSHLILISVLSNPFEVVHS